jgi:hypothetical protein
MKKGVIVIGILVILFSVIGIAIVPTVEEINELIEKTPLSTVETT